MQEITVHLGERSYPIYVGAGILGHAELYRKHVAGRQVAIISDTGVAPLYLSRVAQASGAAQGASFVFNRGEASKNMGTLSNALDFLLEQRLDRNSVLIALGGGVVGDLAGFAAACYQRGIDFIQVPTTLLAQVDSSVGGKTGINHPLGKNMIGAFHQPKCVIIDTDSLRSLDAREVGAGIAEIIKYGIIGDAPFFAWLEEHIDALRRGDTESLIHAISRSCQNKATVVSQDEKESDLRAILNFGHTFGHAFETVLGYGELLHGEAVALGMRCAALLSCQMGFLGSDAHDRINNLLDRAGLPKKLPAEVAMDKIVAAMESDKKVSQGQIRFIVIDRIGNARVCPTAPRQLVLDVLQEITTIC